MTNTQNKRILITGGGSGIGLATTRLLLSQGASVAVLEKSGENAEALLKELGCSRLVLKTGDVSSEADIAEIFAAAAEAFGGLDVLINNAGIGIPTPDLAETDLKTFELMMAVNARGVFLANREALRLMKPAGAGHIITLISMAGQRTNAGAPLYCASKFAARGLSGGLGDQVLKYGIKVTDINPGPVDSNYWGDRKVAREKFLKPEDVADVIAFAVNAPAHVVIREVNFDSVAYLAG
ncbi:MAG: SDR family oxidoreductase [Planctomycetes bacterium]|nr:SDR family oxidoreductase [Planctomycetota bacterium]